MPSSSISVYREKDVRGVRSSWVTAETKSPRRCSRRKVPSMSQMTPAAPRSTMLQMRVSVQVSIFLWS